MADGAEGADETVKKRRLFLILQRFNTIAISLGIVFVGSIIVYEYFSTSDAWTKPWREVDQFAEEREPTNSIVGDEVETASAELVAYYNENDLNERALHSGITIVDPATGKTLEIAQGKADRLIKFDYLYDQAKENGPVVGYVALISSERRLGSGRADLVIGALPGMTKNIVAKDILYADMPTVRGDGTVGIIWWQEDDKATVTAFRLEDGSVIDSQTISLPQIGANSISQGPGRQEDAYLGRTAYTYAPNNIFAEF